MAPVREHGPAQQGLRLIRRYALKGFANSQRAWSSTTRIKTSKSGMIRVVLGVREHGPAQQGLRPGTNSCCVKAIFSQRAWSSTTRIKTLKV